MGKKNKKEKVTKRNILQKMNYNFSRDAEWFKKTNLKIEQIKEELNANFYEEERKKEKIDFLHKLKAKVKDYLDAIKFESRYKKVRFVERRKLERKLTQINKKLESNPNDETLLKEKEKIVDDINYVKFYPKTYKYYALFPNNDAENEEMIKKRDKMRDKIKQFLNLKANKKSKTDNLDESSDNSIEDNEQKNKEDNENDNKSDQKSEDNDDNKEEDEEEKSKDEEEEESAEKTKKEEKKDKNAKEEKNKKEKPKKKFFDPFFEVDED